MFGLYLRAMIARRGLDAATFTRLLVDAGVPRSTVSNWLQGKSRRPHRRHAEQIAVVLGVPSEEIVTASKRTASQDAEWDAGIDRPLLRPSLRTILRKMRELAEELASGQIPESADRVLEERLRSLQQAVAEARAS